MDFYINLEVVSDGIRITMYNFPVELLKALSNDIIEEKLLGVKWYMYASFDVVDILGTKWIISNKTKFKIELIKANMYKEE